MSLLQKYIKKKPRLRKVALRSLVMLATMIAIVTSNEVLGPRV